MKYTLQDSTICYMIKSDMLSNINYSFIPSGTTDLSVSEAQNNQKLNVFQNEHTYGWEAGKISGTLSREKFNLNIIKSK